MRKIRLGTRGSPLALKQADITRAALAAARPDIETEIIVIKTSGDWNPAHGETPLLESQGGKGQFAKEIEEALLDGRIDAGVHSMKDMETRLPGGLVIRHMLPREDPRDCFVFKDLANNIHSVSGIPKGFRIGTCSVRRQAFLMARRPDLSIVSLRGNVQTRIDKLRSGEPPMDAILLACAGLKRLGLSHEINLIADPDDMLPSAGQGAVGIEIHENNQELISVFDQISCNKTALAVIAERAALAVLDGSCRTPIGAHAVLANNAMNLEIAVASLDGRAMYSEKSQAKVFTIKDAEIFGANLGHALKDRMPPDFLKGAS